MKTIPLAAAVTAALLFGSVAQGQTGGYEGAATPGSGMSGSGMSGMSGSGMTMSELGMIAGTTKPQDNSANPAPKAGDANTADMRNSARR